jgi:ubiquinone/menaquinone biosynthesis C-methylase UbiE
MQMNSEKYLREYYNRRAQEFESVYHRDDPIRQREQAAIASTMKRVLTGRNVLEIACGTGFWTEIASQSAQHIVAIDSSTEMLQIACSKSIPTDKVQFQYADAYALGSVDGYFDGGLANFWFSHIPKKRINEFLLGFHKRISKGASVFMADNVYVQGVGGELVRQSDGEDTFKMRELSNGSKHKVLKNYYTEFQIQQILAPFTFNLNIHMGSCFWWVSYSVN